MTSGDTSQGDLRAPEKKAVGLAGKLLFALLGLALALLVLAALLPTLLSTSFGRGLAVSAVDGSIRGSIQVENLRLNWLSGQRLEGLVLSDPDGKEVLRLEEFSTELTLLQALRRRLVLGITRVHGLTGDISVDEAGENNLARALAPVSPGDAKAGPPPLPLTGTVEVSDTQFRVSAPGIEPVTLDDVNAALRFVSPGEPASLELRGESRQGDMSGRFSVTGQVLGLLDGRGRLDLDKASGQFSADVSDLPVDGVDRMLGLRGLLSEALGERISVRIDASGTAASQDLTASASAPHAEATLSGRLAEGRFVLTEPASMRLTVTPGFFSRLVGAQQEGAELRLDQAFPLTFSAESVQFPLTRFDPVATSFRIAVAASKPIRMTASPQPGQLMVRDLKADLVSDRMADGVRLSLDGKTQTRGRPGELTVRADVSDLFDSGGVLQPDRMRIDADISLSGIPTALIDQVAGQGGLLTDTLGENIEMTAQARSSGTDQIDGTLSVDAGPLQVESLMFQLRERIKLTRPARIRYLLQPVVLHRLLGPEARIGLKRPARLEVDISRFEAPRPAAGDPLLQPDKTSLQASLSSEPLEMSGGGPDDGEFRIDKLMLKVAGDALSRVRIDGGVMFTETRPGPLTDISASPLQASFEGTSGFTDKGAVQAVDGRLRLASQGVNGEARFSMEPASNSAALTAPAKFELLLTPSLLARLGFAGPGQPTLAAAVPLAIEIAQLRLPLAPFSAQAVQLGMSVAAKEIALGGDESLQGTALRDARLGVDFNGAQAAATLKIAAATVLPGQQQDGRLVVDAKLNQLIREGRLDAASAAVDGILKLERLPTALIELVGKQHGLAALVGESVDLDAKVRTGGGAKEPGSVDLQASSKNLSVDAGLQLADDITLARPARVNLTLTPDGVRGFLGAADDGREPAAAGFELAGEAVLSTVITSLRWPFTSPAGGGTFNPSRAALDALLEMPALTLRDRVSGQMVTLNKFKATVKGPRFDQPLDVEMAGELDNTSEPAAQGGGKVAIKSRVRDVLDHTGSLNTRGMSVSMDGTLQRLPVPLLDQLLASDGMALATLGESADVTFTANLERMTGPVDLVLRADRATLDMKTRLREDGLVLTEPLVGELVVSQELGEKVLSNIHPIFETTQSAERPIRLEIPQSGVFVPTRNFDITKAAIPQLRIDFGKITLRSGWLLKGVVGLAQQFGAIQDAGREQWSAWFTPAILQLRDGRIDYARRLDVLLDQRLHLATWGTADLARNKVSLVLALMPETLEKVFGLQVAAGDALHIPITGSLDGPNVDYSKAALDLGRLRAQKRLVGKDPLTGALVGAVTGGITGTAGPLPRASVEPLPWGPLPEPEVSGSGAQPDQATPQPEKSPAKSTKEQAVESLIDLLRKPK